MDDHTFYHLEKKYRSGTTQLLRYVVQSLWLLGETGNEDYSKNIQ